MNFNRIVPWIDMSDCTGVTRKISSGAQENTSHVHQFAEGEIGQQDTDKKQMDVKYRADALGNGRMKGNQTQRQLFCRPNVHL